MDTATTRPAAVRQIADLPCPKGLPLIGNLHQMVPSKLHLILERWSNELGSPCRFRIGGKSILVWNDVEVKGIVVVEGDAIVMPTSVVERARQSGAQGAVVQAVR